MVNLAAEHITTVRYEHLLTTPKACFDELHSIFRNEIGKELAVSGQVLATLHNTGRIDAFEWGSQAFQAGVNIFNILLVMKGAVAHFTHALESSIYSFFIGHYEKVKNDLAGGLLYSQLPGWFARHPDLARRVMQLHQANPEARSASLYGAALSGLILHDFRQGSMLALSYVRHSESTIAGPALHALGLIDCSDPSRHQVIDQVLDECRRIVRSENHPLLGMAVGTLGRLLTMNEKIVVELLIEATNSEMPEALSALSLALLQLQSEHRRKEWFCSLLFQLSALQPTHKYISNNVDVILTDWLTKNSGREQHALNFLDDWIAKKSIRLLRKSGPDQCFPSMIRCLGERPHLLNSALTRWFLHNDTRFPIVAERIISHLSRGGTLSCSLDPVAIDRLEPEEIRFLIRRILGYIIWFEPQINLIFSLLGTRDAVTRTFPLVTETLSEYVGYNYPVQTIDYLNGRESVPGESDDVKALCRTTVEILRSRLKALDALPHLKEYSPPSMKARQFSVERAKQMNQAVDEASKDSIWRTLASNVTLKAGRRTFQGIDGRYTEPMELREMSHTIDVPRSEITDPAGAALLRLLYRSMKRPR